jgi:hypothetical protein
VMVEAGSFCCVRPKCYLKQAQEEGRLPSRLLKTPLPEPRKTPSGRPP